MRAYAVVTRAAQQASDCDVILVHDSDLRFLGVSISTYRSYHRTHTLPAAVRYIDRTHRKSCAIHTTGSVW